MEPVTHFLTGACLSRSGFNRKTAYAALAMTLAAEAPDIDIVWGLRGPVAGFQHHRGLTHTLIGAPFMALLVTGLVWLIWRFRRKDPILAPRWFLLWLFALIADLSHLLLDFTNNYGLRPFFPFNPHWYAWSIVFIFDPWIFLALLGALVLPAILGLADREIGAKKKPFRGRGWAVAALTFIVLWWGVRNAEHAHALALVNAGDFTREPLLRSAAEPSMVDPFHWHVLMETRDTYQLADVHTLSNQVATDSTDVIYKPPVTPAVAAAKQSWLGNVYLDWSSWPLVDDRGLLPIPETTVAPDPSWHTVEFEDLRFASLSIPSRSADHPAGPPLGAWVYIGPAPRLEIEGMFMAGREQKP
ncbi:MAG TPA: metal-dependent hydrolase [Acidobacteriaceae bacterium]|jgi:inner membrane protein|nr:metal-dependent hydrolase [Acidobacteriaceae bacterium]